MDEIITDIVEILKRSPSRFAKIFYSADITELTPTSLKIEIKSTLDYFNNNVVPKFEVPGLSKIDFIYEEHIMEKWLTTGLAVGALEHYFNNNNINYLTNVFVNDQEINMEILINV